MPIIPSATQAGYQQALQKLFGLLLNDAYASAKTVAEKDSIISQAQDVFDLLTGLNQGALNSDTAQYATLKATVSTVNNNLQNMKAQIDDWVNDVAIAAQVANAIDQAINYAAQVFH